MQKYAFVVLIFILCGCGSGSDTNEISPSYTVEKNLGVYVGYQKARLVTDDGRLHDPVYNLMTSVVQEGVYLAYQPEQNYSTSHFVILHRKYRDGLPIDKTGIVYIGIGNDLSSYGYFPCYIPGQLYY